MHNLVVVEVLDGLKQHAHDLSGGRFLVSASLDDAVEEVSPCDQLHNNKNAVLCLEGVLPSEMNENRERESKERGGGNAISLHIIAALGVKYNSEGRERKTERKHGVGVCYV
jgi:hypothetical protein